MAIRQNRITGKLALGPGAEETDLTLAMYANDGFLFPRGTTAQRPSNIEGTFRYNTTDHRFEWFNGTIWEQYLAATAPIDTFSLRESGIDTESKFNTMMSVIGSQSRVLLVNQLIPVTANMSIPDNLSIIFEKGGGFNISSTFRVTFNGHVIIPNYQVFFGAGSIQANKGSFPEGLNPRWFGATGNNSTDDTAALQKCLVAADQNDIPVYVPAGDYYISSTLSIPQNIKFTGAGWRSTIFKTNSPIIMMVGGSSNTLRDFRLVGNSLATKGLHVPSGNRIAVSQIRIENINGEGLHCGVIQNSQFNDVFVQYANYGFRLTNTENCYFHSCNANYDSDLGSQANFRNILIDSGRNCTFTKGIYERGLADYQIEVVSGTQITFDGIEVNGGSIANIKVNAGTVSCTSVQFSNGGGWNVLCNGGQTFVDENCYTTGTNGRSIPELYSGNILFNGSSEVPIVSTKFGGSLSGSAVGGATVFWSSTNKNIVLTTTTAVQGIGYGPGTGSGPAKAGQILKLRVNVKNLSAGSRFNAYVTVTGPPSRILIGSYPEGYHEIFYTYTGTENYRVEILSGEAVSRTWEISLIELSLVSSDNSAQPSAPQPIKYGAFAVANTTQVKIDTNIPEDLMLVTRAQLYEWGAWRKINDYFATGGGGGGTAMSVKEGYEYQNHFFNGVTTTSSDIAAVISGTGAGVGIIGAAATNRPGIVRATTGTTDVGRAGIMSHNASIIFGDSVWTWEMSHKIEQLSDSSERFVFMTGFIDAIASVNIVDGIFFLYNEGSTIVGNTPSPNWQIVTTSNSVRTFTILSNVVATGTYVNFRIVVNADATSVSFYMDNVLVGVHTTNIPTTSARSTGHGCNLIKTAGTTPVTVDTDYVLIKSTFATPLL